MSSSHRHEVVVHATGQAFDAATDVPLLVSAAQAGVALPSSCRNGTCRTCMRQLLQGTVRYLVEWPGLTAEEKAQGWILPCVAVPTSPLRLGEAAQRSWWE
ncbi:2Fe-2S iron-sulfur cluster binding domain-containing protein [Ramlibacter sp. AW1]|uniref:2Fe-2S iron-sulfur cluster binding domain-containing protein n=1 Tax=Ramlibacter aurantiacus TaxID=2801330 RepID=A0A936ZIQ0_9BURK|nr:2Fe-2S iron-sulfur cluster-binding protein [Ramlibacter aurantiacus]MBL0420572.1 2Fe-2S iron-sulfur cluster binding domain-containing protein [Ramlibacter aurantiacus]